MEECESKPAAGGPSQKGGYSEESGDVVANNKNVGFVSRHAFVSSVLC